MLGIRNHMNQLHACTYVTRTHALKCMRMFIRMQTFTMRACIMDALLSLSHTHTHIDTRPTRGFTPIYLRSGTITIVVITLHIGMQACMSCDTHAPCSLTEASLDVLSQ